MTSWFSFCCSKQWFLKPVRTFWGLRNLSTFQIFLSFGNSSAVFSCLFVFLVRSDRISLAFAQKQALVLGRPRIWNSPIRSVIIRAINKIGRPRSGSPICYITSIMKYRIGRLEFLLPINHNHCNYEKINAFFFHSPKLGKISLADTLPKCYKIVNFGKSPVW